MFYTWKVADKEYQLKLTMRAMKELEVKLGRSPMQLFDKGTFATTEDLMTVIHCAIKSNHQDITEDDIYDLVDNWIEDGNTYQDLVPLIIDVYKTSGIINNEEEESKNAKKGKK